jgi:hypothetical protein
MSLLIRQRAMAVNQRQRLFTRFVLFILLMVSVSFVSAALPSRLYQGATLTGWRTVVGDAICHASGEDPVSLSDISTVHLSTYSELRANVLRRSIMAHNITFKRVRNDTALRYIHDARFQFRLPYIPSTSNTRLNAQTAEAGLFVWDGADTRLDYGAAFQWRLNPWSDDFGELWVWTGSRWRNSNRTLPVNTNWHTARFVVNFPNETAALTIDGTAIPIPFSRTPKDDSWGTTIDARFQVENVSLYLCEGGTPVMHRTQFRNWRWLWQPPS